MLVTRSLQRYRSLTCAIIACTQTESSIQVDSSFIQVILDAVVSLEHEDDLVHFC